MSVFRTSSLAAISVAVRVASGLALTKITAVIFGPSALALLGQVGSVAAVLNTFAGGGITAGVTKYLAQDRSDVSTAHRILSTALYIALIVAVVLGVVCAGASPWLARQILQDHAYYGIFLVLAAATVPSAINGVVSAALNGQGRIGDFVALTSLTSLLGLAITLALIARFGLAGALHSFAVVQIAGLGASVYFGRRAGWSPNVRGAFDVAIGSKLARYGLMAATTALTLSLSQLVIRDHIGRTISWDAAGQWQAIWQISEGYLLLITMTLSVYYLPRLSELTDAVALRGEVHRAFRIWVPVAAATALAVFLLRDWIIHLLFAPNFAPMRELFAFQLVGDVLKIASWLLSYLMVAKAMTRRYVATEIIFSASFVVLVYLLTRRYGLVGVTYAFAANYLIYLAALSCLFRVELGHARAVA